jgi:tetratricopeptide (TPR) repeat protein
MQVYRYWAFLSYSSHDVKSAQWLHRALENYVIPKRLIGRGTPAGLAPRRFRPIFRDRSELAADVDLHARIEDALKESAFLIVICSAEAAASRWVNEEIVKYRALHSPPRILAVISESSPLGGYESLFPPALQYRDADNNHEVLEPVAADLRPGRDGHRVAPLKLIAGMLGIGLDELVRRDNQRRHRRLLAVTAASIVGMTIAGALATAALFARAEALRQRAHAEGLIEFMLTDLRKKLEPGGKLDMMDGVGREALQYYRAQNPRDLDAQSLARRARALRLVGEIGLQRGELNDALTDFQQASATTAELLDRSPRDSQSIFSHAQNVFWVGEIARQRGNLSSAEISFQDYRLLAERLIANEPTNDDWRAEIEYAQSALGVLFMQQGRIPEAVPALQSAIAEAEGLAHRHPGDLNKQLELGQGHAWLADAREKQGRLAEMRAHREAELAIYAAILAKDPTFRQAKYSTVVALQYLGRLAMIERDIHRAVANFSEAAARGETLLTNEVENMDLTSVVAIAQVDLGEAQLAAGQYAASRVAQQRADALLTSVFAHDNRVARWRSYRDRADLLRAAIALSSKDSATALQLDQIVLDRLTKEAVTDSNSDSFWILQRSRLQTGDDLAASSRVADARMLWTAIVDNLAKPSKAYEPKLLVVLQAADSRLDRPDAAQEIAHYLTSLSAPAAGN